jgi:hypothetical protein
MDYTSGERAITYHADPVQVGVKDCKCSRTKRSDVSYEAPCFIRHVQPFGSVRSSTFFNMNLMTDLYERFHDRTLRAKMAGRAPYQNIVKLIFNISLLGQFRLKSDITDNRCIIKYFLH